MSRSRVEDGLRELGIDTVPVRMQVVAVKATKRTIQFRVVEGSELMGIDASVSPTGETLHGIRLLDGTVYWEHENPVEYQREIQKMEG